MHHSYSLNASTSSLQSASDTPKWVNKKPKKRESIFLEVEVTSSHITGLIDKENSSKFDLKGRQRGSVYYNKDNQSPPHNRKQKHEGKASTQLNQIQNISRFFQKAFDDHPSSSEEKPRTLPEENALQDGLEDLQDEWSGSEEETEYKQIVNKFLHSRPSEGVSKMAYFQSSEIVSERRWAMENQVETSQEAKKRERLFEGGYYTDQNEYESCQP